MDDQFTFIKAPNTPISEQEILDDLKRVSKELSTSKITQKLYGKNGLYDVTTASRKFGSWNNALEKAGLKTSNIYNVTDEELFTNILVLWIILVANLGVLN